MIFHEYEYEVKIFQRFARYCLDMLENFEKSRCCPQGWLHLGQNSLTGKYELFRHGLRRFWKKEKIEEEDGTSAKRKLNILCGNHRSKNVDANEVSG